MSRTETLISYLLYTNFGIHSCHIYPKHDIPVLLLPQVLVNLRICSANVRKGWVRHCDSFMASVLCTKMTLKLNAIIESNLEVELLHFKGATFFGNISQKYEKKLPK